MADESDASSRDSAGWPMTADTRATPAGRFPSGGVPAGAPATLTEALGQRFEVGELLGEGGMGQVYQAFDPVLRRPLALKVLRHQEPELEERFLREAQAQARVDHPNVCKVYEVGQVAGHPYIAMQYVAGHSLDKAAAGLTLEQRVVLMRQVCEAVHAAHQLGLIHRDIKPSNILVEQVEGQGLAPLVTDFGLARETSAPHLTRTGAITGTPQYMSPEQARGSELLDRRTDVYSLGATLYELLAGHPPFTGSSAVDVLLQVISSDPSRLREVAPDVPEDLETIVLKCMDKEVSRRYESARALAEDLQRFLSGDPIQARPATLGYRLVKRARKNKVLTAVSLVSLVAIVTLLALWGATRARSAERARLAQRFGQETERAAAALRYAYMMPLHDIRPELQRVEATLRTIDQDAARIGRAAEGAGDFAVGRALVALRRPDEARVRLERAWKAGYREPEAAYALGRALGMIGEAELEQARRIGDEGLRNARIKAVDTELLQPALGYLRQSEGASLEAPAYAQGLIAFYDGDFPRAIERAQEAQQQVPWLYEARLLAGDALCHQAEAFQQKGQYEQASAALEACGREYDNAVAMARSAPEVYVSQTGRWGMALELAVAQGKSVGAELESVQRWAAMALEADPDDTGAPSHLARAYWRVAENLQRTGGDPIPPLRDSIAVSTRILATHPDDPHAHFQLGSALSRLAEVQLSRGEDPEPSYAQALEHLGRCLELEPGHTLALNNVGLVYWRRGQYRFRQGEDPLPDLERAADALGRASSVLIAPIISVNRGNVYLTRSMVERDRGQDPTASFKKAVEAYEAAIAINPREAIVWSNLASAHFLLAAQAIDAGADPRPDLEQAEQGCLKAAELSPKYASAYNNLSNVRTLLGDYLSHVRGEDPLPAYERAREAMATAMSIKPDAFGYLQGSAEVELHEAEYLLGKGRDATTQLRRAEPLARRACALNPRSPEVWRTLAMYHLLRARAAEGAGRPLAAEVTAGLAAAQAGLAISQDDPSILAHQASLLALRAASEKDAVGRAADLRASCEAVTRARTFHPDLLTSQELTKIEERIGMRCGPQ